VGVVSRKTVWRKEREAHNQYLKDKILQDIYRVFRIANVSCPPVHFPLPLFSHPQISNPTFFPSDPDFHPDPIFPILSDFTDFIQKSHPRFPRNKKTPPIFRPRFSRNKKHPSARPPNLWPFHHVFPEIPILALGDRKTRKSSQICPIFPDFPRFLGRKRLNHSYLLGVVDKSPPVVNKGVSAYLFFWGGGRFNQSLVRRPLFGEIRVSGQVGSAMGLEFGGNLFLRYWLWAFLSLFICRKINTVCYCME